MDGSGCTSMTGPGCGTVNAQYTQGPYEEFILHQNADGKTAIESNQFRNANLRMDGSGITAFNTNGEGIVNAQYYAVGSDTGGFEEFQIVQLSNPAGAVAFQSTAFPGCYLRLDGSGITSFNANGEGTVNVQYYSPGTVPGPGNWETFTLKPLPSTVSIQNKGTGQYLAMEVDQNGYLFGQSSPYSWNVTNMGGGYYTIQITNPFTNISPSFPWFLTGVYSFGYRVALTNGPASANYCQWIITPRGSGQYTFSNVWVNGFYGYGPFYQYDQYNFQFSANNNPPNNGTSVTFVMEPM